MDVCIRTLLSSAQSYDGAEKNPPLQQAYAKLRSVAETRPTVDAPDPFGQDLFIQCAEIAFQYGLKDIARECIKFFFMRQQPTNQFLIRAYICHAQLLAPATAKNPEQLDKAVVFLLKAISLAKKSPRYHFLVYNASVIYWQFCRPFLKPNFRLFLAQSLHQVVKALDEIDDKDNEWRAQLMIALIECYLDAGQIGDASSIAVVGSTFIKQNVPSLYKQLFGLMVRYQLVEGAKLQKEMKNSPELTVFYKICKLKNSKDQEEARDYHADIVNILSQMGVAPVSNPVLQQQERMSRQTTKVVSGRVSPVSGEEFISGNTSRKSPGKSVRRTPTPPTTKKLTTDSCDRPFLLLDLAHLCMDLEYPDLASLCVHHLKSCTVKDQGFYLQLEFIQCMLMVKSLGENQESYQKSVVDVRLQAIRQCEEAVMNAIRFGDPNVIQAGCVTQWNLCLPLLQPNLRRQIYKPLLLVAQALEDIQSLLIKLRCQVHTELAKCEEDKEQIQVAMEHLKKALAFDDGNIYQERLQVMLRRLELRSQLYSQPERQEDQAAMIIEQAGKADSGTIRMKRSLLVKAGEALAPDAFLLVLDSESDTKEEAGGRGPVTVFKQFGGRARTFNYSVRKAEGHLKRLGNENDRERARLWGDLAKTARKQEVWDVCRVAARFCLLYDDGRWKSSPTKPETPKQIHSEKEVKDKGEEGMDLEKKPSSQQGSRSLTTSRVPLYDKDLIRMLAEVNFINGEAMIHLLRSQGVQLNDKPIPPEDKSKKPKGFVPKKPEDDPDWIEYCNWISELSKVSTDSFLRGLELGLELKESWLVCSAAAYIWNYNNHILSQNRHQEIVPSLTVVLDGLKKIGHAGETKMMVNICNALANGLLQPWLPVQSKDSEKQELSVTDKSEKKDVKGMKVSKFQKSPTVSISIDALPDIKKAIEICEYAMQVTSGDNPHDVVPIASRYPLLQTWVLAKQMAQQQISKALGTDDESNTEGQRPMTRAIVAMEMQKLSKNGIFEFKEMSSVSDLVQMVENCQWTDRFTELQLWTHLTLLAYENSQHSLVLTCSKKALRFAMSPTQTKHRKQDKHQYIVQQEMLSYASILLGQSLVDNMAGKNSVRREAMDAFFNSARFARNAENYEMVIAAVRHYWNAIVDLVSQPIERNLIREQLNILLDCITATFSKKKEEVLDKKKPAEDMKDANEDEEIKDAQEYKEQKALATTQQKPPTGMAGKQEEDLTLRAALYGVLFQSYADKGEWEKALQAMDQAISVMPRTKHRLLIFKHRVMVKAKLGQSIEMDMQKFKDESEDYVAQMWRRVALSSKELCEQLTAYQNAIESLANPANDFQKVEYLIEFGQWLYTNEFPLQDVLDQVEWAVDILLNMQEEKVGGKFSNVSMVESKANLKAKRAEKKISKVSTHGKISVDHLDRKSPSQDNRGKKFLSHHTTNISENEDNPEIIVNSVPTVRKITIGLLSSNLNQGIMDLTNVQQLDALIRCHVLLAELTGCDGSGYADTCVMAYSYLHRLWQVLMAECGHAMKEINKVQISPIDENGKGKGKGKDKEVKAPNKPKGKEKEAPVKEKPRRKGPLDSLPDSVEEWSVYDAPDEVIEAFQHEFMKKTGLNEETLPKPMLTMHYLDSLVRHLRELGYSHLALPVLAFEDVLSRSLLENKSLKILVHSRALEVCQELDLKNGCEFHRQIIGSASINQDDQAQSRKEIALWKEKQIQMAREEMRTKEGGQGDVLMEPGLEPEFFTPDTFKAATDIKKGDGNPTAAHLGKVLGAVSLRDVWTDTAEVLIRLGYLQLAREYLNEANMAAQTFSDKPLQSRILFLFGRLAFAEAQYGQAIKCCEAAQEMLEGDEMFWYETTMLMVDAYLDDYTNKKGRHIANMLLLHALNEFNMIVSDHPNRAATIGFITAMIETKTARIQLQDVLTQHKDINVPQAMKAFLAACGKLDGASQKLVRLGHRREAVPYVVEHAKSLVLLAQACIETSMQHAYYLEALVVMKEAEYLAKHVFLDVQSLITLFETRNISLPVERELASVLVSHGELLVMIGELHVNEMQCIQVNEKRKNSLLRTVEEFVRQTPVYAPVLQEWLDNREIVFEEAESLLVNAHNHAGSATDLKAKALLGLGKCMRILAEHKGPDVPSQWLIHEMEVLRLDALSRDNQHEERERGKEREKEEEEEEITDSGSVLQALTDEEIRLVAKQSKQMAAYIGQHDVSKLCFMYASECLTQALNCALTNKHKATAGLAALELVKCFGQYDASSATHFLAFYQSCQNSLHMEKLLSLAQRDPVTSTLAAVLRQRDFLMHNNHTTNLARSPVMEAVIQTLEKDWQAWKMLQVVPQHLELLKEFPSNFTFVILQHSPEKDFLYAAIMDKPRASSEKGVGGKMLVKQPPTSSKAKIFRTETSAGMLEKLVKKFQKHKQSVQALLLKQEYQRTQAAQRQKMLENLDEDIKPQTKVITGISDEANQLEEEFLELLAAMENYLRPVLSSMDTIFSSADGSGEKDLVDECVILLADPDLMELPLEALSFLQVDGITALSRDFSLQMMHHRMHVADTTEETTDKKKKTDSSMSISRIPGARETKSKPSGKAVPTHRSLLPWQVGIETGNIKYFVDAHWDCAETEDRKPIEQFTKILQEYEQQFTSHWLGIFGNDHEPSVGEWEIYLKESSAFIFYGFERFLSYIPPAKVSALNIPDCMVMYLLDLAQTNKSFVRQCKVDVSKSHDLSGNSKRLLAELRLGNLVIMIDSFICQPSFDVPLENPLEMAMLVTLTGTRCIMTNQWYCSLAENTDKLNLTMKDLLQRGKSTGQAVRLLFSPRKRRQEEQVTSALSEDKGKKDDTGSKKGGSSKKGDDSIRKDTSSKASLRPPGTGARPASAIGSVVEEIQKEAPDSAKDSEEAKEDSFGSPKSAWFNMVCYGLPNLVIT